VDPTLESLVPHEVNMAIGFAAITTGLKQIWMEYELAIGAAGSEVVIARYTDAYMNFMIAPGPATQNLAAFGRSVPIGPTEIPAGSRLSHRVRCSEAVTSVAIDVAAYVTGYEGGNVPLAYTPYDFRDHLAGVHRAALDISRPGNTYTTITGVVFPNYTGWVEDTAVAPADLIIVGVAHWPVLAAAAARGVYVQIGTGAGGSEVPRRVVHCALLSAFRQGGYQQMRYPVFVKKGERIALRCTGFLGDIRFKLIWEAM